MLSTKKSLLRKLGCNKAALARPPFTMPHKKQDTKDKTEDSKEKLSIFIKKFNSQDSLSSSGSKTSTKNGNFKVINRLYNSSGPQKSSSPSMHIDKTTSFINHPKKLKVDTVQSNRSIAKESAKMIQNVKKLNSMCPPNTYICKFCCRKFYSFESLQEHVVTHGSDPRHVCYLCKLPAASFSALMSHYLKHSEATRSSIERITAKNNRDVCNAKVNIASAPKSSIRCIHCKLSFSTKDKFNTHHCVGLDIKHEYNCAYCGKISKTVHEYRDHVLSHSVIPFVCSHCGCKFQKKKGLDKHKESCPKIPKRGRPALKCTKCCIQFKNKLELIKHVDVCKSSTNANDKEFSCISCNAKFKKQGSFLKHKETCEKLSDAVVPNFCCSSCGVRYGNQSNFDKHVEVCGKSSSDKVKLTCSACSSVFMKQLDYDKHFEMCRKSPVLRYKPSSWFIPENQSEFSEQVNSHAIPIKSEKTNLSCVSCSSTFKKQLDLDKHAKLCRKSVSTVPEKFNCSSCNVHFDKQTEFEKHINVCLKPNSVTEERSSKVTVNILNKPQATKSVSFNIKSRKTISKEFSCSSCSLKFKKQLELKKHIQVCSNFASKNTCSRCNASFGNNAEFDEHIATCNMALSTIINEPLDSNTVLQNQSKLNDCTNVLEKSVKVTDESVCSLCNSKFQNQLEYENHLTHCNERGHTLPLKKTFSCSLCSVVLDSKFNLDLHSQFCMVSENSVSEGTSPQENFPHQRRSARLVFKKSSPTEIKKRRRRKSQQKQIATTLKVTKVKPVKLKISAQNKISPKVKKGANVVSLLCNLCNYGFSSKSSLLRHKRMHSGNPWYTCKYCGKFFFRKDNYLRHELNVHSKSDDQMLCCCYCRLYYNSFTSLKDHVFAAHKDNAFLPITLPSQGAIQNETQSSPSKDDVAVNNNSIQSVIKINDESKAAVKAILNNDEKNAIDVDAIFSSNMNFFKCGICSMAHKLSSDLKKHFLDCHAVPEDTQSNELESHEVGQGPSPMEKNTAVISNTNTTTQTLEKTHFDKNVKPCDPKSALSSESIKSKEVPELNNTFQIESLVSEINENSDIFLDIPLQENVADPFSCKLCFKSFPNKSALNAHEDTAHMLVEWFQCLVCDSAGPKEDMVKHMMNHMYKVGTFIVNSDHRNFDNILPYLPQSKTVSSSNSISEATTSVDFQSSESSIICGNVNDESNVTEKDDPNNFVPQLKGSNFSYEDSQKNYSPSHQKSGIFTESFQNSSSAEDNTILHGRDIEIGNTLNYLKLATSQPITNIPNSSSVSAPDQNQSRTSPARASSSKNVHRTSVKNGAPFCHDLFNDDPIPDETNTAKPRNIVESCRYNSQIKNGNCSLNQSPTSNLRKVCDNSDKMEIATFNPVNKELQCGPSFCNSSADRSVAIVSNAASDIFNSNTPLSIPATASSGISTLNKSLQNQISTTEDTNTNLTDIVQHFNTANMFRNLPSLKDSESCFSERIASTPVGIGKLCNDCNFVFHSEEHYATHQCTESKSHENMSCSSNYNSLENNQSSQNPQLLRSLLMSNDNHFGISLNRSSESVPSNVNDSFSTSPSS